MTFILRHERITALFSHQVTKESCQLRIEKTYAPVVSFELEYTERELVNGWYAGIVKVGCRLIKAPIE